MYISVKIIEFYFSWNNRLAYQEILDQKEIRCVCTCMHSLLYIGITKIKSNESNCLIPFDTQLKTTTLIFCYPFLISSPLGELLLGIITY